MFLTNIIDAIISLSHFPRVWKTAIVVPIHKPGSDPLFSSNYRPISLLSSLSKLAERSILLRLNGFLSENNIIIPEQFGFRPAHATTHQLLRVVESIHEGFTKSYSTGACFIDISRAFDKIWWDGLLYKLIQLNVPTPLVRLFDSYLSQRSFTVRLNNSFSSHRPIRSSVPQGSLLGPVLFSLFINDIPRRSCTNLALYADDTAVFCTHRDINFITSKIQAHLRALESYFSRWRIRLNAAKSEFVLFTRKNASNIPQIDIFLNNVPVPVKSEAKYLGVTLDSKLLFHSHIKKIRSKFYAARSALAPILKNKHIALSTKVLLFKVGLRPILLYACPIWGTAAKTHLKSLDTAQNSILRQIGFYPWYIRNTVIHRDCNVRPLSEEIGLVSIRFFLKIPSCPNPLISNLPNYDASLPKNRKRPRTLAGIG